MAAAVPFIMIASAAVGAIGAIQQGRAAKAAAGFNASINTQNAQIAREQAAMQAQQQDRENYLRLGSIHAAQGKSGGTATSGSVLDVLGDVAYQGELEKQNILYEGANRTRGYLNTATLDTYSGKQAVRSSYYHAGSALLQGGAGAYSAYNKLPTKYGSWTSGYDLID